MVVDFADLDDVRHPLFDDSQLFEFVLHELVVGAQPRVVVVQLELWVLAFVAAVKRVFRDSLDELDLVLAGVSVGLLREAQVVQFFHQLLVVFGERLDFCVDVLAESLVQLLECLVVSRIDFLEDRIDLVFLHFLFLYPRLEGGFRVGKRADFLEFCVS